MVNLKVFSNLVPLGTFKHKKIISRILSHITPKRQKDGFWKYYLTNSISSIRYALLLSIILYAAFSVLDIYMAPRSLKEIWIIRFIIIIPSFSMAFYLTFRKAFTFYNEVILFGVAMIGICGILAMIAIVDRIEPAFRFYYCGLILCIIVSHSILRLRHSIALILSAVTICGYNLVILIFHPDFLNEGELAILVNNNFFLLGSGVIGAWASSTSEKMFRKDYENQQLLLNEKSELILTKEKLQEANAVKNRLISIISHDIRGPISSLAGISKMFEDRQLSESELKYFMSKMGETLDGTTIMLNNMLSWSVMQMNNTRLVKSYILLRPVIDEILLTLKAQACLKKNQLQNLVDAEIKIHSEPTLLRLVLSNLVTNAIKFTENGLIKVIASEKDNCTEISVTDTGLGMADEVSEKLFKWGSRFTREGTKKEKGSGIGLIICKDLVEKQGGRIFCESKYGHGSKFTFALPKTFEFV